ncbi:hypothetical protein HELRODRAFT_177542 [Helobdella robusta]|uniref:Uncharacterized protein n=1 Tax=Helobdella robusta TaxID=6412 RepID=T1FBV0_HELRO|nr:hypothetical protein HELRODRAFT_177542 [Helobdella robusta]ESN97892.1 hypothetical protein HELRODRAFT_177542 [Helobdella robusta]
MNTQSLQVVILGDLRQGNAETTMANRLKNSCNQNEDQNWTLLNISGIDNCFKPQKFDLNNYLKENNVDCVIALNGYKTCEILKDCRVPNATVISESELWNLDKEQLRGMENILGGSNLIAVLRITTTAPLPDQANNLLKKFITLPNSKYFLMACKINESKDPLHVLPAFTHWHQLHRSHPFLLISGEKRSFVDKNRIDSSILHQTSLTRPSTNTSCLHYVTSISYASAATIGKPTHLRQTVKKSSKNGSCPGVIYIGFVVQRLLHQLIRGSVALVSSSTIGGSCTTVLEVNYKILSITAVGQ